MENPVMKDKLQSKCQQVFSQFWVFGRAVILHLRNSAYVQKNFPTFQIFSWVWCAGLTR